MLEQLYPPVDGLLAAVELLNQVIATDGVGGAQGVDELGEMARGGRPIHALLFVVALFQKRLSDLLIVSQLGGAPLEGGILVEAAVFVRVNGVQKLRRQIHVLRLNV